uniref:Uncharacterized protein n=2 Tax=Anguilla anguilla TaxID=7936 RepID=A0A0E9U984_ANGAN
MYNKSHPNINKTFFPLSIGDRKGQTYSAIEKVPQGKAEREMKQPIQAKKQRLKLVPFASWFSK